MKGDINPMIGGNLLEATIQALVKGTGDYFSIFDQQDSGCIAWGVEVAGQRWLIKYADNDSRNGFDVRAVAVMQNAVSFHANVSHPAIVPLLQHVVLPEGFALVYPWVEGEVLASPAWPDRRTNPASPFRRLLRLSPARRLAVVDAVIDAHRTVTAAGYVAVDFYLGCILYDFERHRVWLIDFDHYHPGPYVLETDRQFGSRSLMAPEEFRRGARIDERATLFTLGKVALELLCGARRERAAWQGPPSAYDVVHHATEPDPADRYDAFAAFYDAWQTISEVSL